MSRESKSTIMTDVDNPSTIVSSKLVGNNTVEYVRDNGDRTIRLHHTDIIIFKANGTVVLDSGGWRTVTTKERMNRYLEGIHLWSDRGVWYLSNGAWDKDSRIEYYDGIEIRNWNLPKRNKKSEKEKRRTKTLTDKINKYVKAVRDIETIPMPSAGDCLYCQFHNVKDGKEMANADCLVSHLNEIYIHGSLIVNAMQEAGYRPEGIGWFYRLANGERESDRRSGRDNIGRAVRRYFKKKLNLAV